MAARVKKPTCRCGLSPSISRGDCRRCATVRARARAHAFLGWVCGVCGSRERGTMSHRRHDEWKARYTSGRREDAVQEFTRDMKTMTEEELREKWELLCCGCHLSKTPPQIRQLIEYEAEVEYQATKQNKGTTTP